MQYTITENLDDHIGYVGQPVTIVESLENDYFIVEDEKGNRWFCGEEELTLTN